MARPARPATEAERANGVLAGTARRRESVSGDRFRRFKCGLLSAGILLPAVPPGTSPCGAGSLPHPGSRPVRASTPTVADPASGAVWRRGEDPNGVIGPEFIEATASRRPSTQPSRRRRRLPVAPRRRTDELPKVHDTSASGDADQGVQKRSASCTQASSQATEQQVASSRHTNSQHSASSQ